VTKIQPKPATAVRKDWNKYHQYMDDLKKETVECITENLVP
jgi:hypothetical protein